MKSALKHWGLFAAGIACLAGSVFLPVPPLQALLGTTGAKLVGSGAATILLLLTDAKKLAETAK